MTEGGGQVVFSNAGGAGNEEILLFTDEAAVGQAEDLVFVQPPACRKVHFLYGGGVPSLPDSYAGNALLTASARLFATTVTSIFH